MEKLLYLKYEDIKRVKVKITSRCNAACPQCPRTDNQSLPAAELKMEDIERIFPKEFCSQLDLVYMWGNYGDAMTSNTTIGAIEYWHRMFLKFGFILTVADAIPNGGKPWQRR